MTRSQTDPLRPVLRSLLPFILTLVLWRIWLALPATAQGPIIYVNGNATCGAGCDGSSWSLAFRDLQDALGIAGSGDEIWVASGIYTPGAVVSDSFNLPPGAAVYGGFAPSTGDDTFAERDWEMNLTILSGDIGGDDVHTAGVVATTADIVGDNSNQVVYADGTGSTIITSSTVLDGFTVTAGQGNGNYPDDLGGGLFCDGDGSGSECSPTLANITFSGNAARQGGAMFNQGADGGISSPQLTHVTFTGNAAVIDGGAMYNFGLNGGSSSPQLTDVTFADNHANNYGGAIHNHGDGGISSPQLINVTFSGNIADQGGAIHNDGDGGTSNPRLTNVTFSGNAAAEGGAMYNYGTSSNGVASPQLINVVFAGNAAADGGAIYNYGSNGIASPQLTNVTIAGNSAAADGGGMFNFVTGLGTSNPQLTNVILWDNLASNQGNQVYNSSATLDLNYTLIQSGTNDFAGGGTTFGSGVITSDPLFVMPITATVAPTITGDYRLDAGSSAADAGLNSAITVATDLDGNPRFYDDGGVMDIGIGLPPIVDLGAYERQSDSFGAGNSQIFLPIIIIKK